MICNSNLEITCCGATNRYQVFVKNDGDIEFMVWRPVSGSTYSMIWSVSETITGTGTAGGAVLFYN